MKNYLTRHRRIRTNEQFYLTGCGVMIDGDDDVRLHHRADLCGLINIDSCGDEPAENYFAETDEFDELEIAIEDRAATPIGELLTLKQRIDSIFTIIRKFIAAGISVSLCPDVRP